MGDGLTRRGAAGALSGALLLGGGLARAPDPAGPRAGNDGG